jgi:phosphate transport system permease protein
VSAVTLEGAPRFGTLSAGRRFRNGLATVWMIGSLIIAAIPLIFLVYYVLKEGLSVISWEFLTSPIPIITTEPGGGIAPAIVGTVLITGLATLISVPLGVLAAIYLNEYGRENRIASTLRFFSELMSGVPSVVMGLFVFTIFTLRYGFSGLGGALALAALMLPIVIRSTEEMLRLVPLELRQGSLALGCSQWRTIVTVVVPAAAPGILSGIMLAIARAAGETAPLLFTIFGTTNTTNWNVFKGPNTALSFQIFNNAQSGVYEAAKQRAWGCALTLVVIVLLCSLGARAVSARFRARQLGV